MAKELSPASRAQSPYRALKHGRYAKHPDILKARARKVRWFCDEAKKIMPWLAPSDERTLQAWAELEVLCVTLFSEVESHPLISEKTGKPREIINVYRLMRQTALAYAKELGATPQARASLGALISDARESDLASELAKIRLEKARHKPPKDITPLEPPPDAS